MTVASRIRLTYIVTDWLTVAAAFFLFNYIRFVYLQAQLVHHFADATCRTHSVSDYGCRPVVAVGLLH